MQRKSNVLHFLKATETINEAVRARQVLPQGKILANEKLRRNCRWAESVLRFIFGLLSVLQVPGEEWVSFRKGQYWAWSSFDKWAWFDERRVGVVNQEMEGRIMGR
ncbi:hypothetical protein RRG08_015117 [Elysia crispata]|uniref:Uncharacterized protein n=1 Tax=Elysia crispata TaxID=231223 RepID=A0AAE0ZHB8_9GAST|nr:hypothetical protein RRG08_015117 [Elysia crispata]